MLRLRRTDLPAIVVAAEGNVLRVRFENLTIAEQEVLTMVLYSRADSWLGWGESRESDDVLRSLGRIFQISMHGLLATFRSLFAGATRTPENPASLSIARVRSSSSLVAFLLAACRVVRGAAVAGKKPLPQRGTASDKTPRVPPGHYRDTFTLNDAGSPQIELHGIDSRTASTSRCRRRTSSRTAKIHVFYAFSPSLLPQLSHIKLILNGTLFATIQPTPGQGGGSDSRDAEADFSIPAELLVHNNTLTIEFIGHYTMVCEDPANTTLWARVHRTTFLDIRGDLLPLADDLKQLPMPFLDPAVIQPLSIPDRLSAPALAQSHPGRRRGLQLLRPDLREPSGPLPGPHRRDSPGNAIVIAENPQSAPGLSLPNVTAPTVAMRTNPGDPYSKVLVITGADAGPGLFAAQAVALHSDMLAGPKPASTRSSSPARQPPDAAPRWARTDQTIALWDYATADQLQGMERRRSLSTSAFRPTSSTRPPQCRPSARLPLQLHSHWPHLQPAGPHQQRLSWLHAAGSRPGNLPQNGDRGSVPVVNLRPFSNSLSFDFTFQLLKKGGCQDTTPINMQGAILRDSYLDLSGYPHYAPMPNLETFRQRRLPVYPLCRPRRDHRGAAALAHRAGD